MNIHMDTLCPTFGVETTTLYFAMCWRWKRGNYPFSASSRDISSIFYSEATAQAMNIHMYTLYLTFGVETTTLYLAMCWRWKQGSLTLRCPLRPERDLDRYFRSNGSGFYFKAKNSIANFSVITFKACFSYIRLLIKVAHR